MTLYVNPRMAAVIKDWPSGGKRVTATFFVETDPKRGQRAVRITTGAPKKLTFAKQVRIVEGPDGKTYIAELTEFGHVTIMQSNMKYLHETVFVDDKRYPAALALFA